MYVCSQIYAPDYDAFKHQIRFVQVIRCQTGSCGSELQCSFKARVKLSRNRHLVENAEAAPPACFTAPAVGAASRGAESPFVPTGTRAPRRNCCSCSCFTLCIPLLTTALADKLQCPLLSALVRSLVFQLKWEQLRLEHMLHSVPMALTPIKWAEWG